MGRTEPQWSEGIGEAHLKLLLLSSRRRIFWGQNDIFFTPEGGKAYLRDLPHAEMHRLDSGHFAVEDSLEEIAGNIRRFYAEKVAPDSTAAKRKTA